MANRKGYRNINGEGSRKVMPDGRIAYKKMVGYKADGKPNIVEVIQRKNETIKDLKKRFDEKVSFAASISASDNDSLYETIIKQDKILCGEWLLQWLETYKKNTVKRNTYVFYHNLINKHIIPQIGSLHLCDLKPLVLQELCNKMLDNGLSQRTVKGVAQIMKAALEEAVVNDITQSNPASKIKIPRDYSKKKEIKAFTKDEEKIFLNAVKGTYHEVFFVMALNTGMRIGEILGLQWDDIDFENRMLHIRHNLVVVHDYKQTQEVILTTPKTLSSIRDIPITAALEASLIKHRQLHMELFGEISGFVFKTNSGSEYRSRTSFDKELKRICAENNLPCITMHGMRHTFATRGLEAGVLPRVMQKLLGHADWNMFYNTYSHVLSGVRDIEQEKLVAALDKITDNVNAADIASEK